MATSSPSDVLTVLVVVDDAELCERVKAAFARDACVTVVPALDAPSVEAAFARAPVVDVVLADARAPHGRGLGLASRVRALHPDVPVVVATASGDVDAAIDAVREGAYDFVSEPLDPRDLAIRLRRAAEWRALTHEVRMLRRTRPVLAPLDTILGRSPAMEEVLATIERVAPSHASVWIAGEPGTGKGLVARALHARGRSPRGPFVTVDCAADPVLLEEELFSQLARAQGGTILFDEVAEMPVRLQSKLMRALDPHVDGDRDLPVEARILSATHRDVEARVAEGLFREDLFYRLNVVEVRLPPLRARGSDVLLLAQELLARSAARTGKRARGMDASCARHLLDYPWPGNVRELSSVIDRAVALSRGTEITAADLPEKLRSTRAGTSIVVGVSPSEMLTLEELERRYILDVLDACRGHRGRAAEVLGVDRKTLYARLKQYFSPTSRG